MINKIKQCKTSIFILVAPSGGGKSSLIKASCQRLDKLVVSVSHTTRKARVGEIEGVHYHFVERGNFSEMIKANEFVEHAKVFDDYYGTSKAEITKIQALDQDLIMDLDWQGAQQMKALFDNVLTIFILPPSSEVLHRRLNARGQDEKGIIDGRMDKARSEMSHYEEADYLIVNDVFEQALEQLLYIINAERLREPRQAIKYHKLLSNLLKD